MYKKILNGVDFTKLALKFWDGLAKPNPHSQLLSIIYRLEEQFLHQSNKLRKLKSNAWFLDIEYSLC